MKHISKALQIQDLQQYFQKKTRSHNVCYVDSFIFILFFPMLVSSPWERVGMLSFFPIAIAVAWGQNNSSHVFPIPTVVLWGRKFLGNIRSMGAKYSQHLYHLIFFISICFYLSLHGRRLCMGRK